VLSLAYFKSTGLPDSLEEIPIEYFEKAFDWLSKQDSIIRDEYAILGGSKGAEIALWLGSKYSQLKAVIALSPSSVIWQGIPINRYDLGKGKMSSWSYQGESLPFLPYPTPIKKSDLLFLRLKKIHEAALQNINHPKDAIVEDAIVEETIIEEAIVEEAIVEEAIVEEAIVEDAIIPVENIQGAVMLISGKRDRLWPSAVMGEQIANRLKTKGFDKHYEHIVFDTGHNGIVMNRDCWRKIFKFLNNHFT